MKTKVSPCLEENLSFLKQQFGQDSSVKQRRFQPAAVPGLRCAICFVDGMVDARRINESIIQPVVTHNAVMPAESDPLEYLQRQVLQVNEVQKQEGMEALLRALLYGDTILFLDGSRQALVLGSKGFEKRSITEPAGETFLKGPREGFVEPLVLNLAMLRRKLRTPDLKLEYFTVGENTGTDCCLCYLGSVVDRSALAQLRKRLSQIVLDGVFDSNYLSEMVRDFRYSPFRTTGSTERPDVAAAKLLEGRIVLFVDGSPTALTVPYIFLEQFQSGEDYYVDVTFAGINRVLRMVGFLFAISVVPVYLALVAFHQAFMPLPLIVSIAKARQGVPFPILLEALLLLLAFDLLREAGARTPSTIAQPLSVVGGLVIGQAAVEARLVSVPVLIVVALSGICSLITPKLKAATLTMRLTLSLLGVGFGIYGYLLGLMAFIILLSEQNSFGVPYLSALPLDKTMSAEDSILRPAFHRMQKFGRFLAGGQRMKRIACVLCLSVLLSGCSRDASELTVVTGIGLDGHPENYVVMAEVLQLRDTEQTSQSTLLQMDGATLTEGMDRMVTLTGRSLYCNHTQVLVVGRETAEAGLMPLLEELLRETQFPVSLRIAVAKDTAAEIMGAKPVVGDIHSVELEKILRESALENLSADPQISTFYEEVVTPGKEAVLPLLELRQNHGEQVSRLLGTALFRDDRLLTVLKEEDSQCLMWMRGQAGGRLKSGGFLLEITDLKCRIKASPEGGVLQLELGIKAGNGEADRAELKRQAETELQQRCEALLHTLQELQCDAVGFGQRLYQTDPTQKTMVETNWPERFQTYPVKVEVKVKNITWGRIWTAQNGGEPDES